MFTEDGFKKARDDSMIAARGCRSTLTQVNGRYPNDPNHPKVREAVNWWVLRARRFHNILMGRVAIIDNMLVIGRDEVVEGSLYLGERKPAPAKSGTEELLETVRSLNRSLGETLEDLQTINGLLESDDRRRRRAQCPMNPATRASGAI